MAYTALYRKLRPQNFNEVIGQEHIVRTLQNQYKTGRVTHSYLFCGTRGTGKTSTAKIFAKLLNCEKPVENSPCGKCELCLAFNENRSMNVFEIDAASNNSVDDIRELRDEIKYPPTKGKYKVYIIDEVHMLSIGAFNALLKTLEEPPSYIVFILATTDPQKIPVTILSRCQRFDFKRISTKDMVFSIQESISNESIDIDEEALKYIAKISDGAMRDALSILDQCNSFYFNEKITLEKVLEILGSVDDKVFFKLTDALIFMNSLECINIIDELILDGRDIHQFISDLIQHFRNIIVSGVSNENILDISDDKFKQLKEQYNKSNSEYFIKLIIVFSEVQNQVKYSTNGRIILEATCIKLCYSISEEDIFDIKEKIKYLEKKLEEKLEEKQIEPIYIEKKKEFTEEEPMKLRKLAVAEDFKKVIEHWKEITPKFDRFLRPFLETAKPQNLEDDTLYIVFDKEFNCEKSMLKKDEIQGVLAEMFDRQYEIIFILKDEFMKKYKKVASEPAKKANDSNLQEQAQNLLPEGSFEYEHFE